jgi:hypothetical protein
MDQEVMFDTREQLRKIQKGLLPEETVYAVFDMKGGGTGFIGITDKRVMIQDSAFIKNESAIVSIPYDRIHALATSEETGMLGGRGVFAGSKLVLRASVNRALMVVEMVVLPSGSVSSLLGPTALR